MPDHTEIRETIRRLLGSDAHADVKTFDSGAMAVTIHTGTHTIVIDGQDATGWGWSIDPKEQESFTGHTATAPTFGHALADAHDALTS